MSFSTLLPEQEQEQSRATLVAVILIPEKLSDFQQLLITRIQWRPTAAGFK